MYHKDQIYEKSDKKILNKYIKHNSVYNKSRTIDCMFFM